MSEKILFEKVSSGDLCLLTDIMTRAFNEDTSLHTDSNEGGPNGYDDGTLIVNLCNNNGLETYKILYLGAMIGAYTITLVKNGECSLEMMFIDPNLRGSKIGTRVWSEIEKRHNNVKRWITETPDYSKRNYIFYTKKCGFKVIEKRLHHNGSESYIFEKDMS